MLHGTFRIKKVNEGYKFCFYFDPFFFVGRGVGVFLAHLIMIIINNYH